MNSGLRTEYFEISSTLFLICENLPIIADFKKWRGGAASDTGLVFKPWHFSPLLNFMNKIMTCKNAFHGLPVIKKS